MASLWGKDFEIVDNKNKILSKIKEPKKVNKVTNDKVNIKKSLSIEEKLSIIEYEVNRILGVYKNKTQVIYTKEDLHNYISKAIENGVIAVDTETNNSLDPLTCKLMGACLYTPGMNNAYIPVNHRNHVTKERLLNQCTEKDIREEFARLGDTKIVYHNAKFDYKVIYCTCDIKLNVYWDTLIAARMLNENERAGLKQQYIDKIDPSIEKYSIDHLFANVEYADVPPEIFALYAATDSFMTYELYKLQKSQFEEPGRERLYKLLTDIEFPIISVVSEMELRGISLDTEYCKRLHDKYHEKLDAVNKKLEVELSNIKPKIDAWRLTEAANYKPQKQNGKFGKSKSEQLADPPELTSPIQLAILLYDILGVRVVDKTNPRGTGEEILKELKLPLTEIILEQRTILKMLNAFIDALPGLRNPRDNKIHSTFNQLGTDTGRFSCKEPNLQQIPASNKEIRMMFMADDVLDNVYTDDTAVVVTETSDLYTPDGWRKSKELNIGDVVYLYSSETEYEKVKIESIKHIDTDKEYLIKFEEIYE